jgi:hypothetical protein
MPGARCARSRAWCVVNTRVSHRRPPEHPAFPHAMVLTVCFVLSPVIGLCCHRHLVELPPQNLTPASRRQDHTTSPSAASALVFSAACVHRIPPRVRDDRDTPLEWGRTGRVLKVIWVRREAKYFCKWGWTGNSLICPSGSRAVRGSRWLDRAEFTCSVIIACPHAARTRPTHSFIARLDPTTGR